MNKKPTATIPHIGIYGQRNAGKSSLLNALVAQDVSLVSEIKGTTTDPVKKRMELIPFGPVIWIDTAGFDDSGLLGDMRVERTRKMMMQTDFAVIVVDINEYQSEDNTQLIKELERFKIEYLVVFNKIDTVTQDFVDKVSFEYPNAKFISSFNHEKVEALKQDIISHLSTEKEPAIVGDLVPYGSTVVLVIPIDSEAPKGRIILPQVQVIRDCLDHGIKTVTCRDTELADTLKELNKVDLVITDSQAFNEVSKIVPNDILLTSFSILFARYKGDLDVLRDGMEKMKNLTADSKILIAESCSHNLSHEDIGRVKIPKLIEKNLGFMPDITHKMGQDFPKLIEGFDFIVHCGSCMLNKKTMESRIMLAKEKGIPIVNYGVLLAYFNGIYDRSLQVFDQ
jgi:[FeFe] hydrogenase H-cluster maturation GTPase HydF